MMIDCDACAVRGPVACGDCVVTVLLGAPPIDDTVRSPESGPDPGVDLDGREQAAIAVLAGSGLVPPLRLVPVDRSQDVVRPADLTDERRDDEDEGPTGQGRAAV